MWRGEFPWEDAGRAHVSPVWIPRGGTRPSPGQPTPIPWAAFRGTGQRRSPSLELSPVAVFTSLLEVEVGPSALLQGAASHSGVLQEPNGSEGVSQPEGQTGQ